MFSSSLCGFMTVKKYWPARETVCLLCKNQRLHFHRKLDQLKILSQPVSLLCVFFSCPEGLTVMHDKYMTLDGDFDWLSVFSFSFFTEIVL